MEQRAAGIGEAQPLSRVREGLAGWAPAHQLHLVAVFPEVYPLHVSLDNAPLRPVVPQRIARRAFYLHEGYALHARQLKP